MNGFYNQLLRINLTNQTAAVELIPEIITKTFLGGRGLGSYLLLREIAPGINPLSENNKLIFSIGPLTDYPVSGVSRYCVLSKSPLTGAFADSTSGGDVAPAIKRTGYDAIIIEGRADVPLCLEISDEKVCFHRVKNVWGKDAHFSETSLLDLVGVKDAQAIVIGPAGENLVKFACIQNNFWRSAGRTGLGAVMGSKMLKGIVFHGKAKATISDFPALTKWSRDFIDRIKGNPGVQAYLEQGTSMIVDVTNKADCFPSRYWTQGFSLHSEKLNSSTLIKDLYVGSKACHLCPLSCGKVSMVKKGPYSGLIIEGPEYETIYSFGGLCCVESLEEVAYLNDICDRLGMDTISAGNIIALLMEAQERGKFSLGFTYGNTEAIANMLYKIALREGIGNLIAEGTGLVSKELNLEDLAIHVKGLEPPGYDPRRLKGMGLAYAVSPRGACHLRATFYKLELSGQVDPSAVEKKADLFIEYEDRMTIFDCLIMCRFFRDLVTWNDLVKVVNHCTGQSINEEELRLIARRISDLSRLFNLREGFDMKDDTLPKRMFNEVLNPGGYSISSKELYQMVSEYYMLRGWDNKGVPTKLDFVQELLSLTFEKEGNANAKIPDLKVY